MVKSFDVKILDCYAQMLVSSRELPGPLPCCLQLFEPRRTLYEVIAASNAMQNLGAHRSGRFVRRDHLKAMALIRELQKIYNNLKGGARWTAENVNRANGGFFLFQ